MNRMERNRLHREVIVQGVGLVQSDRERRGCRGGQDHRAGYESGLTRADPPVPALAAIPEVLKMPEVPQVPEVPEMVCFPGLFGSL
jgi:hypothetical protein